jgi:hypothetical protein
MNEEPTAAGAQNPDSTPPQQPVPPASQPAGAANPGEVPPVVPTEQNAWQQRPDIVPPAPAYNPLPPEAAATPPPPPPATPASTGGRKLPSWLPLIAAALIPAVLVGLIVFFVAGGSEEDGGSCNTALDGFVRLSLSQGEEIESSCELPQGFPDGLPVYDGATLDGGFAIKSAEGTTFIVAYSTDGEKSDVYKYYLEQMDEDPWQIELSREADDFTGMQFSRPDSADVQGSITISHSELDNRTAIFVFLLDASQTSTTSGSDRPIPAAGRALPPGFPKDVPIFEGKSESIILDTYFQREAGQNAFLVSFLTKDADVDVINFYTQEFQKRGWAVRDGETEPGDFALTVDFDDNKASKEVQGSIRADVYAEDASYTEVNLIVQVSASRGRGN